MTSRAIELPELMKQIDALLTIESLAPAVLQSERENRAKAWAYVKERFAALHAAQPSERSEPVAATASFDATARMSDDVEAEIEKLARSAGRLDRIAADDMPSILVKNEADIIRERLVALRTALAARQPTARPDREAMQELHSLLQAISNYPITASDNQDAVNIVLLGRQAWLKFAALATQQPNTSGEREAVADQMIGQIEDRFPNWRSFRDLIDCIDCTLHDLRKDAALAAEPKREGK